MQDELGMQLYDFHARQYDPQIGKFWGVNPADQFPSGYTGMGNDSANSVDPTGMLTRSNVPWKVPKWTDIYAPQVYSDGFRGSVVGDYSGTDMDFENPFTLNYYAMTGGFEAKSPSDLLLGKKKNKPALATSIGSPGGSSNGNAGDNGDGDGDGNKSRNNPNRNPAQDKKLSNGEIRKLKSGGDWNHHEKEHQGKSDLYKDKDGNVYEKHKDGSGYGIPLDININELNFLKMINPLENGPANFIELPKSGLQNNITPANDLPIPRLPIMPSCVPAFIFFNDVIMRIQILGDMQPPGA